jgi:pimeloyl-ACP methyl ester carboxylesterase
MTKLVLFIHGFGGDADSTWKQFPELIRADGELTKLYNVYSVSYDTGFVGSQPSLASCAQILKTEIDNRYKDYSDIALIAHSQGGLIARAYIAERLNSNQPLRVSRLLTFATPHHGSGHATLLKRVLFSSQQVKDLDPNSEFLRALGVAWGQAKADRHVRTIYAVAANDAIVGQVSAMGQWSPDYEVIGGVGHKSSVKPGSASDTSFLVAKNFLLQEPLLHGGVEADYRTPLLRLNYVEAKESTRFIYAARVLPFIGRDAEIDKLGDFLGGPEQPFRWMVLHGSGGVGKSRLALELCLALRSEWHAGFLPQEGEEPNWGRWQPLMPTLIVVDYAARDTERTGRLLRTLSGRGAPDGTMRLSAPVRVLLIERMGNGDWLDKIVGTGTTKAQVEAAHAPEDLQLLALSDPWPIFEFVLDQSQKPLPDKPETLAALEKIDPERRPLFAYFMADAIAVGHDVRHFDAERLLDDVINRGRENYWKPAGATAREERLLALATMTGGLPVSALESVTEKLLPAWDIDRHPAAFLAMTGRESGEKIAALEPNIVGEHFALSCLAQKNLSDTDRARFCDLAWRLNPLGTLGMGLFMLLSHRDLPNHAMLPFVRKSPPSGGWPELIWAMASVDLMIDLRSRDLAAARALLGDMRSVAQARGEPALWEQWAEAANNLMVDLPSRDPAAARALLSDIRAAADKRGEPALWEIWAKAAFNLMFDLSSRDPAAARALLGEMRAVAKARDEAPLWEYWAKAAYKSVH